MRIRRIIFAALAAATMVAAPVATVVATAAPAGACDVYYHGTPCNP